MHSVSNSLSQPPQAFFSPRLPAPQALSRHVRETPAPNEMADTSRAAGDRELAIAYLDALLLSAHGDKNARISTVPAHSTFGQWWALLHQAFQSSEVRQWVLDNNIDTGSITLDPASGQVSFRRRRDPTLKLYTLGQDDHLWAAISGPILQAARVIGVGAAFTPATQVDDPVPLSIIGRFYQEPQALTPTAMRERANEIDLKGLETLDPATSADLIRARSESALQNQKAFLADIDNRHTAAAELRYLATSLKTDSEPAGQIREGLKNKLDLSSDSSYQAAGGSQWNQVSLQQFLKDHGWDIPTSHEQLLNLATALSTPTPKAPPYGNLGGALTWPEPLDPASQALLKADMRSTRSLLQVLLNGRPISSQELSNPRALISALINSPRARAMGEAIQAKFEERSIKGTAADWLLAAMNIESNLGSSNEGKIDGFRLVSADSSGKSPSEVVRELTDHLVATGKVSSLDVASVQANLMLASRAPEFLVKDIPEQVVVGTHSWVSFATAVARIEAKAPGATAAMSYAQVMVEASIAPITDDERRTEYVAQNEAVKDWAIANGMNYPSTAAAMTEVRKVFSAQVSELREAADTQIGKLPTTKDIALEQLKKALPDLDPKLLEEKSITSQPTHRDFPGPYSILDLFIDGRGLSTAPDSADNYGSFWRGFIKGATFGGVDLPADGVTAAWVSSSNAININHVLAKIKDLPRPQNPFEAAFANYASAVKKTTRSQIKHLISKLPLEDRQALEFGKITIRKEVEYSRDDHPLRVAEGSLLVQTERDGKTMTYEIDRLKGTITKRPGRTYEEYAPTNGQVFQHKGKRYDTLKPVGEHPSGITDERKGADGVPNSFSTPRTQYIADAIIHDMDLPAVRTYAKGATTFDTEVPTYKIIQEIALSLIPLRSAIINFSKGNIGEGFGDLAFDIFGFAVGLGAAFKGAKGLLAGASALSKVGQGLKIVGRAAVGALNPLGGVDDLVRLGFNGARNGLGKAYTGVKQLRGSYRSVDLFELAKKPDVAEVTLRAANNASDGKALAKFDEASNKWHRFDPLTQKAYGKPLENVVVDTPKVGDTNSLQAIASNDVAKTASQQHGLAARGTFKVGQETIEGNVVMFQGNWHQYDAVNKRAFGPPLKGFTPSHVAASGELRAANSQLLGYEARYLAPDELALKGLHSNVYVGRSKKEYIKVDGEFYESRLRDGQRVIRHPAGNGPDIAVTDVGAAGWKPTAGAERLLGGEHHTPWRLGDDTYVVPMDDIKVVKDPANPYRLDFQGADRKVTFSNTAGAWSEPNLAPGGDAQGRLYFWRTKKGKWARGDFTEFQKAKKIDAHKYAFVDTSSIPKVPKDLKPVPKEFHYFWAGQEISPHLIDNMARNATHAPGYKSIIHVDADSPAVFQQIKGKLESKGITVMNLHEDEVFKRLKQGELYDYFRQGQGKNLAAASDVARYPIMSKHSGFYLDTDDVVRAKVDTDPVKAGTDDVLLGHAVNHNLTDFKPFYNTSNFGTHAGNPVIEEVITEMHKRFADNKAYFSANRPTVSRGADGRVQFTPEFNVYERKIFDTVGPNLFNDVLKQKRPDMYDFGMNGFTKEAKVVNGTVLPSGKPIDMTSELHDSYLSKGLVPPDLLHNQVKKMQEHYFPLRYKFDVKPGAEHSWINT